MYSNSEAICYYWIYICRFTGPKDPFLFTVEREWKKRRDNEVNRGVTNLKQLINVSGYTVINDMIQRTNNKDLRLITMIE